MVDHGDDNVVRFTLAFVILTIILFTGIFSMMQPDKFGVATLRVLLRHKNIFSDVFCFIRPLMTEDGALGKIQPNAFI
jgi:hypothetical protein